MKRYNATYWMLFVPLFLLVLASCTKDFPQNVESDDEVVLQSIKILNAGAAGNTVVEGVIDENTKTVSFPRLDPETNFDAIRFEATMSNGAHLDKESYEFVFGEGEATQSGIVKVVNNKRFREYRVTLRLNIPVFGADFGKPSIYDYSNNELGNPIYPDFTSANTRATGFDGENILIVTRSARGSHIIKASDVKNNDPQPQILKMPAGGLAPYTGGLAHGHSYMTNLAAAVTSKINLYHWASPTATPELIYSVSASDISAPGARHGDNMSVNLDENGNGYIYMGDNNGGSTNVRDIIRLKITNFTSVSEPTVVSPHDGISPYMSFNRIGNTGDYLLTGYAAPLRLVNVGGTLAYTSASTSFPINGSDPRVVYFNGERYLIMTTAARGNPYGTAVVLYVYDITKGNSVLEALKLFDERADKSPLFEYSLLGPVNASPGTQTGWSVTKDAEGKDQTLTLFSASCDAGFVMIEFPKKTQED